MRNKEGRVWGVVTRSATAMKYRYPTGVSAASTVFGEIRSAPVVVLVEGASDVMALQQAGIPQHWVVLGCYGAGLHMPQKQIVVDCGPRVILAAFDDDVAGRNATLRTELQLNDVAPVLSHHWSTMGAKDPGDMPIEDRITALQHTLTNSTYSKYA
jgi:DNA primase